MASITKRYLKAPDRGKNGWTEYIEETITVEAPKKGPQVVCVEVVMRGKKLCLFGKFLWDYKIEVLNYREYKVPR
jgi:hypothetical protein